MEDANRLRNDAARHFREPIIEARKDREDRTERQHVMEMRHNIISVVKIAIDTGIRENDTGHTTHCEEEDEADGPLHGRCESDRATPHRCDPREDLHAGRHRDNHCREHEVTLRVKRKSSGIHVVRPHDEADCTNRHHRISHAEIAEDRLLREGRDDMADDAKARQNHDVHFRVTEEPEEMLIEDRITAIGRIKEGRAEITIGQQHRDRAGEDRKRQKKQEGRHKKCPRKERHLVHGHARRAHIQNRCDEIDCAQDRRCARQVK